MLGRLNKVNKNYEKNNDKSLLSKRTDSFYKNEENITYDKIDVLEKKSKMFYFSKNKQNNGYRDFDSELEFNNSKEKMQFYNFRNEDLSITDHDCLKLEFDNQEEIIEDIELNINSGYLPLTTGNEYRVTSWDFKKGFLIIQNEYVKTTIIGDYAYVKVGALHLITNKNTLMFESIYNTENYNKYELNENLNLDIIENEDDRLKLKELLLKFNCKNFKELKESICFDIQTEIWMKDETNVLYIKLDNINLNKKSFNEFSCTELDKIHEVNNKYNDMIVDIIDKLKKN